MDWKEIADWVARVLALVGLPGVVTWFLYDRRRVHNEDKQGELAVDEAEATLPNRVRSSSVVTLEAEIMALSNSFDTDRRIKDETIQYLRDELGVARAEIAERDRLIDSLQEQLNDLKRKVSMLTRDLDRVQQELDSAKANRQQH